MGNILSLKLGEIPPGTDDGLLRRRGIRTDENRPQGRSSSFVYSGTTPVLAEVTTNHLARPVVHDAAGNEIRHIVNREYSARNLLSIVRDDAEPGDLSNHRVSYWYDGRGVRVNRLEVPVAHESGARRHYFYSPELSLLSATRDSVANWWDGSADPVPGQPFHYEIVWFGTRPVARVTGGTTRFTFADHLGTPIMQTDAARDVVWRAEYEPFGNIYEMRVGSRSDQPLRFPGQEAAMNWEGQEENYNIFRWYRAGWGRYTQSDPIGLEGGWNLYRYAAANPLTYIDPLGLKVCRCDRRLAFHAFAFSQWFYPVVAAGAYHSFIQIVPNDTPCGGYEGIAWGFQDQGGGVGHVEPERTPAFNPMLRCREVSCIDENLLRRNINSDSRQTSVYRAVCRIGSGWNAQNCQGWADDVLQRSRAQTCCYSPGQGGPI